MQSIFFLKIRESRARRVNVDKGFLVGFFSTFHMPCASELHRLCKHAIQERWSRSRLGKSGRNPIVPVGYPTFSWVYNARIAVKKREATHTYTCTDFPAF